MGTTGAEARRREGRSKWKNKGVIESNKFKDYVMN